MSTLKEKLNDLRSPQSTSSFEVARERIFRHHLTFSQKFHYFVLEYSWIVMGVTLLFALLAPAVVLPLMAIFMLFYFLTLTVKKQAHWEIHRPIYQAASITENIKHNLKPVAPKETAAGILHVGNDKDRNNKSLWFSSEQILTHMVIFGTTGSGKTQFLLALLFQFALLGSGFILVDGKSSINTWFNIYSILKELGLEDNLLVLNFLTAGKTNIQAGLKNTHTLNPFAHGSSDSLMEMLSNLMGEEKGDNSMWRGRAEALGRCLLRALCELRDQKYLSLSIDTIREYMPLKKLMSLHEHEALSTLAKDRIKFYLHDLPGWELSQTASEPKIAMDAFLEANKQHGFLTMQFTQVLEMLAGTYAHITKTDLAEIDFTDVIINRRMLYIMLPALEKSQESLKSLARVIVSSIRTALADLLGGQQLTGSKTLLLDTKPYKSSVPFPIFLDEYGSYAVEGFADVAAQARELNVMLCFLGQDYSSFKRGSEIEAERIISNTGIKVFLKTECNETATLAIKRGGKAYSYAANHIEQPKERHTNAYKDTGQGSLQEVDRIIFDELFSQKTGECHITYGDKLWRVKSFYGDFKAADYCQLNAFIKLRRPSIENVWSLQQATYWKKTVKPHVHPAKMPNELIEYIEQEKERSNHEKN